VISRPDHIISCDTALTALSILSRPFFDQPMCLDGIEPVEESSLPPAVHKLLAHQNHMTTTLQDYHGEPVTLHVLRHHLNEHYYIREILLTLPSSNTTVEYGMVRLDLGVLSGEVREEVLAQHRPLGDILIGHDVMRRIELRWLLKLSSQAAIWKNIEPVIPQESFGRIGIIYCHHQPAIELFEVVLNVSQNHDGNTSGLGNDQS